MKMYLPIERGDIAGSYVSLPEGTWKKRRGGLVNITLFKGIEYGR